MGFFDRFKTSSAQPDAARTHDEQAIARYRYLLRTAPPEAVEQAHAEAFARLTPQQRQLLLQELASDMPDAERNAAYRAGEAPGALARVATRAELREPGAMERAFGRMGTSGGGVGFGGMLAGSMLGSLAGTVLGTMIAQQFFTSHPEASQLFGSTADAGPAASGDLADDPWQRLDSSDAGADSADLGGGMDDGGSFDV
jgi:hypothetical protein